MKLILALAAAVQAIKLAAHDYSLVETQYYPWIQTCEDDKKRDTSDIKVTNGLSHEVAWVKNGQKANDAYAKNWHV